MFEDNPKSDWNPSQYLALPAACNPEIRLRILMVLGNLETTAMVIVAHPGNPFPYPNWWPVFGSPGRTTRLLGLRDGDGYFADNIASFQKPAFVIARAASGLRNAGLLHREFPVGGIRRGDD